ncbi:hypothetical protein H4R33_000197 [Dimargaris cristalligena]|uniref:Uncharacterized protein n=1 Tax=Dimargaris cristalligena TaxID=215637 RepID=A0A4P9ZTM1_9FUNG|nr:hypothetical protein H4R33_000197 [Dimargaris cristalligena]RKP36102.1 hypothetical protein BJ085DRAFT_35829 [Dimargaris cristalligena]|eukprot:RKP36102.1 hypothetical protein BJ085DRAFT_35829 [Dimargaris cristalligena]
MSNKSFIRFLGKANPAPTVKKLGRMLRGTKASYSTSTTTSNTNSDGSTPPSLSSSSATLTATSSRFSFFSIRSARRVAKKLTSDVFDESRTNAPVGGRHTISHIPKARSTAGPKKIPVIGYFSTVDAPSALGLTLFGGDSTAEGSDVDSLTTGSFVSLPGSASPDGTVAIRGRGGNGGGDLGDAYGVPPNVHPMAGPVPAEMAELHAQRYLMASTAHAIQTQLDGAQFMADGEDVEYQQLQTQLGALQYHLACIDAALLARHCGNKLRQVYPPYGY